MFHGCHDTELAGHPGHPKSPGPDIRCASALPALRCAVPLVFSCPSRSRSLRSHASWWVSPPAVDPHFSGENRWCSSIAPNVSPYLPKPYLEKFDFSSLPRGFLQNVSVILFLAHEPPFNAMIGGGIPINPKTMLLLR